MTMAMQDTGRRAKATPAQKERPGQRTTREIREILAALRGVGRRRFWVALVMLILGGLTEGMSILLLLPVLQVILKSEDATQTLDLGQYEIGGVSLPDISISLEMLLSLFVLVVVAQVAFNRMKTTYLNDTMFDFTNGVRLSLFSALSRARWDRITRLAISDLEHALTSEVERISTCGMFLLAGLQGLVMLAIYAGMSLLISPPMTLLMLGFGVVALVLMRPFRRRATQFGELLQESRRRQFATVSDFLNGLKIARATNGERVFFGQFQQLLNENKRDTRAYVHHSATGSGLFHIMITLGAAIFIYIAVRVLAMDFASLVVLLLIAMRIAPRFMSLQMQMQQLLPNLAAWRHLRRLETDLRLAEDTSAHTSMPIPPLKDGIVFEGVSYRHEGAERPAVRDLTLEMPAGRVTALIGMSGSGKSTIADLVTGLIQPTAGRITFDGRPLSPPELRGWREQIAYVAQENFLLNLSVRENLTMISARQHDEDELWQALELAAAADFVRALPNGIDTVIGNRGVQLSGGERQRLALALAFLRNARFLVLDEATSALDWKTQEHVANSVRRMARQGLTVLTIAHRPSMVAFADTIHAIGDGQLIESGSPSELMAKPDGDFAKMLSKESTHTPVRPKFKRRRAASQS
ncbi:ABC transporter ATP-binding protein [Salipiger abyssi]|uniref:ABC transporter ATP-binding protein n=1 Tax=Salipiger abyssi TaxID=1250539 RepID=UPI001A8C49A9|nr:ABC transporter ATP-binding protein [Salipiger abyssi]MBN9886279.1 ABC transporter ATP-binding protein [Salipiger abyssi]